MPPGTARRCSPAGPGTGKTTMVARVVLALADQFATTHHRRDVGRWRRRPASRDPAPGGGRRGAVGAGRGPGRGAGPGSPAPESRTLHRLLGWQASNTTRFQHDRANRLRHDLIVVDEASMVDLTMMARLLEAVRTDPSGPGGRPRQLTSVGAGAVPPTSSPARRAPRLARSSPSPRTTAPPEEIKALAAALRDDADADAAEGVLAALRAGTR